MPKKTVKPTESTVEKSSESTVLGLTEARIEELIDDILGWKLGFKKIQEKYGISQSELDDFITDRQLWEKRLQNPGPALSKLIDMAIADGEIQIAAGLMKTITDLYPPQDKDKFQPLHIILIKEAIEKKEDKANVGTGSAPIPDERPVATPGA